ncbi:C4-dicarboxylate ABC transporter [Magnetovibrio sp.]|uniref:TRAP transporter substrate-binding protein n=1 Tax=Magnetovibrio sp. TaxID=2024836 RepID=UPI002F957218
MRNTIIGIVIGVVVGVMVGATVVAPRLEAARHQGADVTAPGAETLGLKTDTPPQATPMATTAPLTAPRKRLRIISMYPAKTPVLGELPLRLQKALPIASGGRLGITVFDPGTLVESDDTLNAVKSGTVEALFATPGRWAPDAAVMQLFTAVPFGPGAAEHLAWYYHGGGRELLDEAMKKRGLHATLCGAVPPAASGWYRAPVRGVEGFKGLNIRAEGLGGDVLAKLGANIQRLNVGDILSQFEQGQLDGAEYSLPSVDAPLGFQKFARNYYFPGWRQPVTLFTLVINAQVWNDLTGQERTAINTVCGDNVRHALVLADAQQFEALKDLSLAGVQVRRWPDAVLHALEAAWKDVAREQSQNDQEFAKVWGSMQKFHRDYAIWREISNFQ